MDTVIWSVDKSVDKLDFYPQILQAAELLKQNNIVAFPTETVYGLGGNAFSDEAIEKIYKAKGRPSDNPLIIHIADVKQMDDFVDKVPEKARLLMERFWPGPLTIIIHQKEGKLSEKATAGLSTVAVRMPDHPVARSLIRAANLPIAAPSANRSGKPSPTTAQHVYDDLNGKIAAIIDGGPTGIGVESTVIDCTEKIPRILRPGGITKEQIEKVIGSVHVDQATFDQTAVPKSPGMKYTHYAPKAPLYLVKGDRTRIQKLVHEKRKEGLRVGVLTTEENVSFYEGDVVLACGRRDSLETVSAALYGVLRKFDKMNVDIIFSEMFPHEGVGVAIMNRLLKAAGHTVI